MHAGRQAGRPAGRQATCAHLLLRLLAAQGVERARLRLVPSAPKSGWAPVVGELIEVNGDDWWWEARVQEKAGKKLKIMYRVSDEVKSVTMSGKLRPCSWLTMS